MRRVEQRESAIERRREALVLVGREQALLGPLSLDARERVDLDDPMALGVHANVLLDSVVSGLQAAKEGGAFGSATPFLVVWISDSGHEIMAESVRRLNSAAIAKEFMSEFG